MIIPNIWEYKKCSKPPTRVAVSLINHPFWGTNIYGNPQVAKPKLFSSAPGSNPSSSVADGASRNFLRSGTAWCWPGVVNNFLAIHGCFLKMGVPQIIHLYMGCSLINHLFWGTPIHGTPHMGNNDKHQLGNSANLEHLGKLEIKILANKQCNWWSWKRCGQIWGTWRKTFQHLTAWTIVGNQGHVMEHSA